jgi:hypothetical protein
MYFAQFAKSRGLGKFNHARTKVTESDTRLVDSALTMHVT